MQLQAHKIGLLILVVILLPVLIFSAFEIGNLRRNERIVQEIYSNQLDAILFSINQYSDDIISSLAGKIENILNQRNEDENEELQKLIVEYPSVQGMIRFDKEDYSYIRTGELTVSPDDILTAAQKYDSVLVRLQNYMRDGYRKIEKLKTSGTETRWIVFITSVQGDNIFTVLILDPREFIDQTLDPKIQEIAQEKFDIVAFYEGEKLPFYSSDKQNNQETVYKTHPFWLLDDYQMGIEMHGTTISDLAISRSKRNILIAVAVDLFFLAGAWLIYRNVTRQIELSRMKSEFVSNVSHEIRTPLSLIRLNVETLEMGRIQDPAKIRQYHSVILSETIRLSNIVNRILSFSRIENNKHEYELRPLSVNENISNALDEMRHIMKSNGFHYLFIPGKELPSILANREALSDALVNLIDNAMKYSAGNKHICVKTGMQDKYVFIEVEDHGIGIPEKDQAYIFDKFYRVTQKNLAGKAKGSGLGLAIVKQIMETHGGLITVKSTPGAGSSFRLLFPAYTG